LNCAAVFISDTHLGLPESTAALVLWFRENTDADRWFWLGDVRDLWVLTMFPKWWGPDETALSRMAMEDFTITGNHDGVLATVLDMPDEMLYVSPATCKRYLLVHGHQFDPFIVRHLIASILATWANLAAMLVIDPPVNWLRKRLGVNGHWSLASAVKHLLRRGSYLQKVKARAVAYAKLQNADGIVFGHTHECSIETIDGILVANTGAGIELTAVAETDAGDFVLLDLMP
jgi:UDP-2,3-diacylglucosamine pyrophosphatase LpxH